MIIKTQSVIYINAQKFSPGFTSYFNIGYLDVSQNLRTGNQKTFFSIGFEKFSENQSNILCMPFSSFSKIGNMSGRQVYRVASSAKLALLNPLCQKRGHIHIYKC